MPRGKYRDVRCGCFAASITTAGIDAEQFQTVYDAVDDESATCVLRFPDPATEPEPTPPGATTLRLVPPAVPLHQLAPTGTESYSPCAPPASSWPDGANVDAAIDLRALRPPETLLPPLLPRGARSYRAFTACPANDHATEF